jgi:ubiquinone/menaquinone biosynthesis C-methylase UbiE
LTFKAEEAATYDRAAECFAALSEKYAAGFAEHACGLAAVGAGDAVLDVGTGAGLVASAAAARARRVVGIDIAPGMIALARRRAEERGLAGVEFRVMDAEALAFAEATFDVVVSLFAVLHLPSPLAALGEMRRVLRPGGRLVVAAGARAPLRPASVARELARRWRERAGRGLTAPRMLESLVAARLPAAHDPAARWREHARAHGAAALRALVAEAGFESVEAGYESREATIPTAAEFWDVQRTFSSAARRRLDGADPAAVDRLRDEVIGRADRVLARGGRLVYPQGACFVRARRPA